MKVATCPGCKRTRIAIRIPRGKGQPVGHVIRAHGCSGDRRRVDDVRDAPTRAKP